MRRGSSCVSPTSWPPCAIFRCWSASCRARSAKRLELRLGVSTESLSLHCGLRRRWKVGKMKHEVEETNIYKGKGADDRSSSRLLREVGRSEGFRSISINVLNIQGHTSISSSRLLREVGRSEGFGSISINGHQLISTPSGGRSIGGIQVNKLQCPKHSRPYLHQLIPTPSGCRSIGGIQVNNHQCPEHSRPYLHLLREVDRSEEFKSISINVLNIQGHTSISSSRLLREHPLGFSSPICVAPATILLQIIPQTGGLGELEEGIEAFGLGLKTGWMIKPGNLSFQSIAEGTLERQHVKMKS
nr:hypothetical protein Iba_chr01cCG4340 [Ipomoea batatas]